MKLVYLLLIFLTLGCQRQSKLVLPETSKVAEVKVNPNHIKEDYIEIDLGDELPTFSIENINKIIDEHPEFFEEFINDPEIEYYKNIGDFGSELGQDHYYVLYYYFLKQRNPSKEYEIRRKRLIELFQTYNALHQRINYGGTYFGHQGYRIYGIAEYILDRLPPDDSYYNVEYDFLKQKKLYIRLLKQYIADEIEIDENLLGAKGIDKIRKAERKNELDSIVNRIDSLTIDRFYLRLGQEFNYRYY
jgi:hypothetical protein